MWLRASSNLLFTCSHCLGCCDVDAVCRPYAEPVLGYELVDSMFIGKETTVGFDGSKISPDSLLGFYKAKGKMFEVADLMSSTMTNMFQESGDKLAGAMALLIEEKISRGKNPMIVPLFGRMTPRKE